MQKEKVSLATLGGGAAVERFDHELQKALNNIADFNTPPEAVREVTLKVRIKPNQDRDFTSVQIIATSKLAAIRPEATSFYIGSDAGEAIATEYNPKQERLAFNQKESK
jgi:hypothetical protein